MTNIAMNAHVKVLNLHESGAFSQGEGLHEFSSISFK